MGNSQIGTNRSQGLPLCKFANDQSSWNKGRGLDCQEVRLMDSIPEPQGEWFTLDFICPKSWSDMDLLFYLSIEYGNIVLMKYLMMEYSVGVNIVDDNRTSPLHLAVKRGQLAIVEELLRKKSFPNLPDLGGWTSLHIAAHQGNIPISLALFLFGANPLFRNRQGVTPYELSRKHPCHILFDEITASFHDIDANQLEPYILELIESQEFGVTATVRDLNEHNVIPFLHDLIKKIKQNKEHDEKFGNPFVKVKAEGSQLIQKVLPAEHDVADDEEYTRSKDTNIIAHSGQNTAKKSSPSEIEEKSLALNSANTYGTSVGDQRWLPLFVSQKGGYATPTLMFQHMASSSVHEWMKEFQVYESMLSEMFEEFLMLVFSTNPQVSLAFANLFSIIGSNSLGIVTFLQKSVKKVAEGSHLHSLLTYRITELLFNLLTSEMDKSFLVHYIEAIPMDNLSLLSMLRSLFRYFSFVKTKVTALLLAQIQEILNIFLNKLAKDGRCIHINALRGVTTAIMLLDLGINHKRNLTREAALAMAGNYLAATRALQESEVPVNSKSKMETECLPCLDEVLQLDYFKVALENIILHGEIIHFTSTFTCVQQVITQDWTKFIKKYHEKIPMVKKVTGKKHNNLIKLSEKSKMLCILLPGALVIELNHISIESKSIPGLNLYKFKHLKMSSDQSKLLLPPHCEYVKITERGELIVKRMEKAVEFIELEGGSLEVFGSLNSP